MISKDELDLVHMMSGQCRHLTLGIKEVKVKPLNVRGSVPKQCFNNSFKYLLSHSSGHYVLGFVMFRGMPIEHAWVRINEEYLDVTLDGKLAADYVSVAEFTFDQVAEYVNQEECAPTLYDINRFLGNKKKNISSTICRIIATEMPESEQMEMIEKSPLAIKKIENPCEAALVKALSALPMLLKNYPELGTETLCKIIKINPLAIKYISNASDYLKIFALQIDPSIMSALNPQSEDFLQTAITEVPAIFRYLPDPSPDVEVAAVKADPSLIKYISNPSPRLKQAWENGKETLANNPKTVDRSAHAWSMPKGLTPDQILVVRWMQINDVKVITPRQLKSLGDTPILKELLARNLGKDVTLDDVLQPALFAEKDTQLKSKILDKARLEGSVDWVGGSTNIAMYQRVLARPNHVSPLVIPFAEFVEICELPAAQEARLRVLQSNIDHPPAMSKDGLVLGWVRYCIIGKDIWIDEIQSDLCRPLFIREDLAKELGKWLPQAILNDFVRYHRQYGAQKFYLPDSKSREELYNAKSLESVYEDLPQKARFKRGTFSNVDPKVDGRSGWILASTK